MKKTVISWNMIKDGLRRMKVASFIYAALIVLAQFVVPLLSSLSQMNNIYNISLDPLKNLVPSLMTADEIALMLTAIPFIMAPVLTLIVFYPFNKRGSSDFYHSLPYSRTCIYLSWTVSVMIVTFAAILGGMLIEYLILLPFSRVYTLSLTGLGDVLFTLIVASMFAISAVELAMTITGTWLSNIAASMLIMFLPRFIMYIIKMTLTDSIPILTRYFLQFFNYEYNVFVGKFCDLFFGGISGRPVTGNGLTDNIGPDAYTLVLSLCLMAVGLILFNKRKSEAAGQSAQNRTLQAAIRIAITFTISLIGTVMMLIGNEDATVIIVIYIIALIAFFAYEIITTHKWKNLVKALPSLLVVIGLNLAFFLIIVLSKNIILNRNIPADKIESVRVVDQFAYNVYDEYFTSTAKNIEITDEEVFQMVSDKLAEANETIKQNNYYRIQYGITYPYSETNYLTGKMVAIKTGGQIVWRALMFTADDMQKVVDAGVSDAYKDKYMQLPDPVYNTMAVLLNSEVGVYPLSADNGENLTSLKQICDSLQKEINAAGFEKWFRYLNYYDDMVGRGKDVCTLTYSVNVTGSVRVKVPVTQEMFPETYDLIITKMAEKTDYSKVDEFISMAKSSLNDPASPLHFEFSLSLHLKENESETEAGYLYVDTWGMQNNNMKESLGILENCMKNGKKPDADGFIVLSYNCYDQNNNENSNGTEMIPLPVDKDLLKAFYEAQ